MSDERRPPLPAVPPPRRPDEAENATVLALGTLGLCPLLWFLAPVALVMAHTEIRALRSHGRAAPLSLRWARGLGLLGTVMLGMAIICSAGYLAPLS